MKVKSVRILNRFTTNNFNPLSNYVWETKRALDQSSSLKYTTFITLPAYSNFTKFSQFFLYKKYPIITYPDPGNLLIRVSEIMSKSPHQQKTRKIKTLTQESWYLAYTTFYGILLLEQSF